MASLEADGGASQIPGLLAMDAEPVHLPLGVTIEELVKVSSNFEASFLRASTQCWFIMAGNC